MKIYDAFLFFNELDLLEIRLELLYNHVDHFIISECDTTFSGKSKPFYFEENKERFSKYSDKIIHVKNENSGEIDLFVNKNFGKRGEIFDGILNFYKDVKYSPLTGNGLPHWCREFLHREYVKFGMLDCQDEDLVIFGDLDEIPDPTKLRTDGNTYTVHMKNFIYFINVKNVSEKWLGTVITKYENIKSYSLNRLRNVGRGNIIGGKYDLSYEIIENGGWHLSYMGGSERIREKIKSYGHQEYNHPVLLEQIESKVKSNQDILNRGIEIVRVDLNEEDYYPKEILDLVKKKFAYLIK